MSKPSDSSPSSSAPREFTVACPRCGTRTVFSSQNPSRPFCSERCKLIDLGQWANEDYKIPTREHVEVDLPSDDESEESR